MARKTSDMVLLLGSRGQYRGRSSGFFGLLRGTVGSWFGGKRRMRSASRGMRANAAAPAATRGFVLLAAVFAGFVGGFFVRGQVATAGDGTAGLHAAPRSPGIVGEIDTSPLANQAFIVAVYPNLPAAEARQRANALSEWLRNHRLEKARPYEFPTRNGPVWVVAVYFDGDAQKSGTRDLLVNLPQDVPDTSFAELRKREEVWPEAYTVQ